ncbi:MAG: polysaccharide deacetylase family protein [Parvularculaceae bacterium]
MPLPAEYLRYEKRRHGQDHALYPWRLAKDRLKGALPDGAKLGVAMVVPLEYFMLNPSGKPFKHPGAMQTPYPDLRHYTTRDYGNRVGAFRLLDAFAAAGIKATFAVNAVLLDRVKPLIDAIRLEGHEIAAHGWDTDSIHWGGIDPATEEMFVRRTREAFDKAGLSPRVWMSPARQQSFRTLELIAAAGFDLCLDWEVDTVPVTAKTPQGGVTLFPLLNELDDRNILTVKNHSEDDWRDQILEAAAMTASEFDRHGAQIFAITLTPYIAGLPFRIAALREILGGLRKIAAVAPVSAIADGFSA